MTKTRDLADLGGGFIQAGTGAVQRTVESKLQDVVSVKDFGASTAATPAQNYTAITNALAHIYSLGGGTLLFDDLYDIGNNKITIIDTLNYGAGSTLHLQGRTTAHGEAFNLSKPSSGITGSASTIIEVGDGVNKCNGAVKITNFCVVSGALNQRGLDLRNNNSTGIRNVQVDLDTVAVVGFEGPNAICIDAGGVTDCVWNKVFVAGKNTQPGIGINIDCESPKITNSIIRYCKKGINVTAGTTNFVTLTDSWVLACSEYHIYIQTGGQTKRNVSSFTNCFIGESNATNVIPIATDANGDVYASFFGCTIDRNPNSTNAIFDFQANGKLSLFGCANVGGYLGSTADIKLGQYPSLVMLGCNGFTAIDSTLAITAGDFFVANNIGLTTKPPLDTVGIRYPTPPALSANPNVLDDYKEGTSGPTDKSGAALTFTNPDGRFTKIGDIVTYVFSLSYPTTSNTLPAKISLPYATPGFVQTGTVGLTNLGTPIGLYADVFTDGVLLRNPQTNAAYTNANLSGKFLYGSITYKVG